MGSNPYDCWKTAAELVHRKHSWRPPASRCSWWQSATLGRWWRPLALCFCRRVWRNRCWRRFPPSWRMMWCWGGPCAIRAAVVVPPGHERLVHIDYFLHHLSLHHSQSGRTSFAESIVTVLTAVNMKGPNSHLDCHGSDYGLRFSCRPLLVPEQNNLWIVPANDNQWCGIHPFCHDSFLKMNKVLG